MFARGGEGIPLKKDKKKMREKNIDGMYNC